MVVGRSGDEAAFAAFVRASGASLLRTAFLLTGDRGLAEDVVQVALERTARRWGRLHGSAEAYARRVVINGAHDGHRRRLARPIEVASKSVAESTQSDPTTMVDLRDALVAALRRLPPRQRSVVVCRYILDLDERETALALGVGLGTVKASANRGLATLRELAPDLELSGAPGGMDR
jgi:RNA polymerase sigma-70 factor (sigma-E family)